MSHFRLHTKGKERNCLLIVFAIAVLVAAGWFMAHRIGTVRAKSRETVLLYTAEELEQYLLDSDGAEYNLDGKYRLEEDLDLSWLYQSIGTNLEPFTGSFDGNGHVISGLTRPLFGVIERAEVENLFLSEAEIGNPFTYYDGEHYVDGYSALAAYAVGSKIKNCGMNGTIYTASPSEAEYLLEKASPSDAGELKGPGAGGQEIPGDQTEAGESSVQTAGPGMEVTGTETTGTETTGTETTGTETTGTETTGTETKETETTETAGGGPAGSHGEENEREPETGMDSEVESSGNGESKPVGETEMTAGSTPASTEETDGTSFEPSKEGGTVSESSVEPSGEDGSGSGLEPEATESVEMPAATEPAQVEATEVAELEATEPKNAEVKASGAAESKTAEAKAAESVEPKAAESAEPKTVVAKVAEVKVTKAAEPKTIEAKAAKAAEPKTIEAKDAKTAEAKAAEAKTAEAKAAEAAKPDRVLTETAEYHAVRRQTLAMKVSSVPDINVEELLEATPPNAAEGEPVVATPPNASDSEAEGERGSEPQEDEPHYTGSPNGDICILVTADRVAAGGLIAQTADETLISDSFALITIGSFLGDVETYTGGLAAILGAGSKAENSYATGLSDSDGIIGGFAAVNDGRIENCYSTLIVGEAGCSRGAFTASGNGSLSGCVYDRQMACVAETEGAERDITDNTASDAEDFADFGLKAWSTADMTGAECRLPGNWRKVEQAYPQLEYFAQHAKAAVSDSSRASAIALMLPENLTLLDFIIDGDVIFPSEIDGAEISWEAEGNLKIDEKNQVIADESAVPSIEANDIPVVGSALKSTGETARPVVDNPNGAENEFSVNTEETGNPKPQLKASVGTATKYIAIRAVASTSPKITYADWNAVGEAIYKNTNGMGIHVPADGDGSAGNPYLIGTPEALAWLLYKSTLDSQIGYVKLTADIDLFGTDYNGGVAYEESTNNITSALKWNGFLEFIGTFDGDHHVIRHMYAEGDNIGFIRNIGSSTDTGVLSGVLKNLGMDSSLVEATGARSAVLAGCLYYGGIYNCWLGSDGVVVSTGGSTETGGIVGGISGAGTRIVEGCYNLGNVMGESAVGGIVGMMWNVGTIVIRNCYNMGTVSGNGNVGGIGGAIELTNPKRIENCYNSGTVSGLTSTSTSVHSIFGGKRAPASTITITNCYYDSSCAEDTRATELPKSLMNSWELAYALNNQGTKQKGEIAEGLSWAYRPDENNGYPYLSKEGLDRAKSWPDIIKGVDNGLIKAGTTISGGGSQSDPYLIHTEEGLTYFAAKVNAGETNSYCRLQNNMDLTGIKYGGTRDDPVPWYPAGAGGQPFTGTFDGNDKIISGIKVSYDGPAGLFSVVSGNGAITKVGVSGCTVTGTAGGGTSGTGPVLAGAVAGRLAGNASIIQCYNRGGSVVTADGTAGGTASYAGGIIGQMSDTANVKDCYHLDSKVISTGSITYAGGIAGDGGTGGTIQNSYSACGTSTASAAITASGTGAVGSITGTGGTISRCYSEARMSGDPSDSAKVEIFDLTSNEQIWKQTDGINTVGDTERTGDNRVWFTSLAAESTRGLPTFTAPEIIKVTLNTATESTGTTITLEPAHPAITGAILRGVHQDKNNSAAFTLTAAGTVSNSFHAYGKASANEKIGFKADSADLGSLVSSLTNAAGNAGSIGNVSQLTLYTGAAYTLASDRVVVIDISSDSGQRYEIQVKIPGVTSKTLSVELTKDVTIHLNPNGQLNTSESGDAQMINHSSYPVEGGVTSLTPVTGDGYIELTLVKKDDPLSGDQWITDSGVRIGVKAAPSSPAGMFPAEGLYYDPASPAAWMNCRVKGSGSFTYRYFIEYMAYYNFWENHYGFEVNYQFRVSEGDFKAAAGDAELVR